MGKLHRAGNENTSLHSVASIMDGLPLQCLIPIALGPRSLPSDMVCELWKRENEDKEHHCGHEGSRASPWRVSVKGDLMTLNVAGKEV
jgi:hypothetical protein